MIQSNRPQRCCCRRHRRRRRRRPAVAAAPCLRSVSGSVEKNCSEVQADKR